MLKIGVMGLGNICQKAYLPLYSQMQDSLKVILASNNQEKVQHLQKKYGFSQVVTNLDDLLAQNIDACFIHSATQVHYAFIKQCLKAGVAVYVDKPISEDFSEVQELIALANSKQLPFYVGFNRRYVPLLTPLTKNSSTQFYLQKNRRKGGGEPAYLLYDLMIHLMDTAVFLMHGDVQLADSQIVTQAGVLQRVNCRLVNRQQTAFLTCNFNAGANQEIMQSESHQGTYRLTNLNHLVHFAQEETHFVPADWQENLTTRGFKACLLDFLQAVEKWRAGESFPVQPYLLQSHQLIAEILAANENNSERK